MSVCGLTRRFLGGLRLAAGAQSGKEGGELRVTAEGNKRRFFEHSV